MAVKTLVSRSLTAVFTRAPLNLLALIESAAALSQGKGWGTATCREEVAAILQLIDVPEGAPCVVFDVGANVGSWSEALLEAEPNARVYCFEPSKVAFATLEERFAGHGGVVLSRMALGESSGTAQLYSDRPGSGLASLVRRRLDHLDIAMAMHEEVEVSTLDAVIEATGIRPTILKLDVEGWELSVLKGGGETLRSVACVQFEFGGCNIDTRTYFQDFYYFFKSAGFDIYRLSPRGVVQITDYVEAHESFVTTNFVAVRRVGA